MVRAVIARLADGPRDRSVDGVTEDVRVLRSGIILRVGKVVTADSRRLSEPFM